jgi:hypothetical protein
LRLLGFSVFGFFGLFLFSIKPKFALLHAPPPVFDCGDCMRIVILDKEGKLRYNASYIKMYFVESIIHRYLKKDEK